MSTTNVRAWSSNSVQQCIYQVAFIGKVVTATTFAFGKGELFHPMVVWILLGIDLIIFFVVLLTQVCAAIRMMSQKILSSKVVVGILGILMILGIAEAVFLGIGGFGGHGDGAVKAAFAYDIVSTILVIVLAILTLVWPMDTSDGIQTYADAELGAADRSAQGTRREVMRHRSFRDHASQPSLSKRTMSNSRRSVRQDSVRQPSLKEVSARSHSTRGSSRRSR